MQNRFLMILAGIMLVIIILLAWMLLATPASGRVPGIVATTSPATTATAPATTYPAPLSAQVSLSSPQPNATVSHTFNVSGRAPGPWYFEAQFPIQVRDSNDNIVGRTTGQAQGNWQTDALVPFNATITVDASFQGTATLILLKDNPSGLPQNDDSVTIPIVVE